MTKQKDSPQTCPVCKGEMVKINRDLFYYVEACPKCRVTHEQYHERPDRPGATS